MIAGDLAVRVDRDVFRGELVVAPDIDRVKLVVQIAFLKHDRGLAAVRGLPGIAVDHGRVPGSGSAALYLRPPVAASVRPGSPEGEDDLEGGAGGAALDEARPPPVVLGDAADEDEPEPYSAFARPPARRLDAEEGLEDRSWRCSGIGGPPFVTRIAASDADPSSARRATSTEMGEPAPWRRAFSRRFRQSRRKRRSTTVTVTGSPRTSAPTRAPSSARTARASTGSASPRDSGASRRAAVSELLDELVELRDVALDARAPFRISLRSSIAIRIRGERRVRSSCDAPGEDVPPARSTEALDPVRGPVEARREAGDLVLALHLDPRGERARPELVHPRLQPLEPPREPAASGQTPSAIAIARRTSGPTQSGNQWGNQPGSQPLHAGSNLLRAAIQRPSSRRMTIGRWWPRAWCEYVDFPPRHLRGGGTGGPAAATTLRDASYRVRSMRNRSASASRAARAAPASSPGEEWRGSGDTRTRSEDRGASLKSSSKTARPIHAASPARSGDATRTETNPR